ncbi:MAG: GNAT family N-acetyltransferase [Sporolactobacillus sp.]
MLIRYKKCYEKIAVGLLSLLSTAADIKNVFQTVRLYEDDDRLQLFLWKQGEDIIGVLGIQIMASDRAVIRHISVNPSYREEGIDVQMCDALAAFLGADVKIIPLEEAEETLPGTAEKSVD